MKPEISKNVRDPFFDALKFVAIFIVVWMHTIQPRFDSDDKLLIGSYTIMVLFIMPLFIFISGYFSKNMTWDKFKKGTLPLIATLYIFQAIFYVPQFQNGTATLFNFIIEPRILLWYLQCLIIWRFMACFFPKNKYFWILAIGGSLTASLILGFRTNIYFFESLRIISFLPFFLFGYYCPPKWVEKIRSMDKAVAWFLLVLIFLIIYEDFIPLHYRHSAYGTISYKLFHKDALHLGVLYRFSIYPVGLLLTALIIAVTPSSARMGKWGAASLTIYVLHVVFREYAYRPFMNAINVEANLVTDFLATVLVVILCIWLHKFKAVQTFINPIGAWLARKDKKNIKA